MRRTLAPAVALTVLLAAGCGSQDAASPQFAPAPGTAVTTIDKTERLDAEGIVKKLKAAGLGLTGIAVQDEDTDPNNLLGRPNGYTSRASADLPGGNENFDQGDVDRGLVVEVFDNAVQCSTRKAYIASVKAGNSIIGTEYQYVTPDGTGLIRVGQSIKPSLAKKIEAAVGKF